MTELWNSRYWTSFGNHMVTDLVFAYDEVILIESLEVLVLVFEVLH